MLFNNMEILLYFSKPFATTYIITVMFFCDSKQRLACIVS